MTQKPEKVIQRIQQIRKRKLRSIYECASLLDIPREHYLQFEEGTNPLALPDMELLASFFDVPLSSFFNNPANETCPLSTLPHETRSAYKDLRHKMIQVKFILLREEAGISLKVLHESTGIPLEALENYDRVNSPIPLDHLCQICSFLGQPINAFFSQEPDFIDDSEGSLPQPKWKPEYPEGGNTEAQGTEDPYIQLVDALKKIPKEDQARIAKILLNNLKSL